jgi:hypothetical protein
MQGATCNQVQAQGARCNRKKKVQGAKRRGKRRVLAAAVCSQRSMRVIWRAGFHLGVFIPAMAFSTLIFHFFGSNCPTLLSHIFF